MAGAQEAKARRAKEAVSGVLVSVLTALGPTEGLKQGGSQSGLHLSEVIMVTQGSRY